MNKNEFQIGDWCFDKKAGIPCRVTATILMLSDDVFNDTYDPLPLSPEIFVKNGYDHDPDYWNGFEKFEIKEIGNKDIHFQAKDGVSHTFNSCFESSVQYRKSTGMFEGFKLKIYNQQGFIEINDFDYFEKPFYVHELQHLFKLLKVNKEIIV